MKVIGSSWTAWVGIRGGFKVCDSGEGDGRGLQGMSQACLVPIYMMPLALCRREHGIRNGYWKLRRSSLQ